ncbi:MAG: class I SAM-dependent methyltransferase, partial [Bacteroidales bacterium]|nr:class I SAM-dependent methyltransferase [Bacteroidales bacterium]
MNKTLLTPDKDPMGHAIRDFYQNRQTQILRIFSPQFEEDEFPINHLFRTFDEMPPVEQKALTLAEGQILDVGAGSGCHTLALYEMGKKEVDAIDISELSVEVMRNRGINSVKQLNFFDASLQGKYDTILMLMNGSGIIETLENLPRFFDRARELLAPNGSILMDSSDLSYLYEQEDGSLLFTEEDNHYFGEIEFTLQYGDVK